jgi:outer membrane protein assembly factor BamB
MILFQKGLAVGIVLLFLISTLPFINGASNVPIVAVEDVQKEDYQQYFNNWSVHLINQSNDIESIRPIYYDEESRNDSSIKSNPLSGPMDSAWPMQSHDVKHTGRSQYSTANNHGIEIWWIHGNKAGGVESSAVIDNNYIIYFGTMSSDHSLYALYPNGTLKWKYVADDIIWCTPAIAEDGTIYFETWGGYLHALYPNGTKKWSFTPWNLLKSSPAIGNDGTIYFGCDNNNIYAVNANGTEKWHYVTGYFINSAPAIGDDGTIYIGSGDGYLYTLYQNGTLRWRYKTGDWIKGNPSIAEDSIIYVPSFDGYLYALYPDGTMKWRVSTGSSVAAAGVALAEDGTIYVATELIRAYYPNGTLRWSADVQGDIYGTIPAVSADGTIYVSAGDSLVAVNPDGSERWRQTLSNEQILSSPSIGENDRVYVGSTYSDYGYLHAFGPLDPNAPIAPTITGQTNGRIKRTYDYTFTSTSPLGKQLYYLIDWGDGTTTDWLGPYTSGEPIKMNHSWSEQGTYNITARAKDTDNRWGPWGELQVTMPKTKELFIMHPLLKWLLERFPHGFPILRYLLGFIQ